MTIADFEHERAARQGGWIKWSDRQPENDLVIRLRGPVQLTGMKGPADPEGKYARRGQALGLITSTGSLHHVRPPYDSLEWMPG